MSAITASRLLKVVILFCALALTARAVNPIAHTYKHTSTEADSSTPMEAESGTPMEAESGTSTSIPAPPSIKFIFENGTSVIESLDTLKDCEAIGGLARNPTMAGELDEPAKQIRAFNLPDIANPAEYARFKSMWTKEEPDANDGDLTPDEFIDFFAAANCLGMSGDSLRRLAANMTKRGLFGQHSAEILKNFPSEYVLGPEIAQHMLLVFAEQVQFMISVENEELVFYPLDGQVSERVIMGTPDFKLVSDIKDIAAIKRAVLLDFMPVDSSKHSADLNAVLGWLLCRAGIPSLSARMGRDMAMIAYEGMRLPPGFIESLTRRISAITRPYGKMQMVLEGLDLLAHKLDFASVKTVLEKSPHLKDLRMDLQERLAEDDLEVFSALQELETILIRGRPQVSSVINQLVGKLPKLKNLEIWLERYMGGDILGFSGSPKLETLKIHAKYDQYQPSSFVTRLLETVPELKQLTIWAELLNESVAASFANCPKLEKLDIQGSGRNNPLFVQQLLNHASNLKHLTMRVDHFESKVGTNLTNCESLETLEISGTEKDSRLSVAKLMEIVPKLKQLTITDGLLEPVAELSSIKCLLLERMEIRGRGDNCSLFVQQLLKLAPNLNYMEFSGDALYSTVADSVVDCPKLETLKISGRGKKHTNSFVEQLLENVPELKDLRIYAEQLDATVANSFGKCPKLERLVVEGDTQTSSFVQRLPQHVLMLKALNISAASLDDAAADSFDSCPKLEILNIDGTKQTNSFVVRLLKHVPAVWELRIHVDKLNSDVGTALSKRSKIQKLDLTGKVMPGFFMSLLQAPLLDSLKELRVYPYSNSQECSTKDNEAIGAAKTRGIYVLVW